ncbi:MAG: hypothetical protein RL685_3961 [Pseudomonadota bacterium]|jgi:hypothetical protein
MKLLVNTRKSTTRSWWRRPWLALAVPMFFALEAWTANAHAGERILLLEFGGRASDVLRDKVAQSLEAAGHTVIRVERTSKGLNKRAFIRLAESEGADAIVDGTVRRLGMKSWVVALRVIDGDKGVKVGSAVRYKNSWLPGLTKDIMDTAADKLDKSLVRATGGSSSGAGIRKRATRDEAPDTDDALDEPEAEESEAAPEPREAAAADEPAGESSSESSSSDEEGSSSDDGDGVSDQGADEDSDGGPSRILGAISARVGVVHRTFDFSDDKYDRLRKQDANIWVYQAQAELYPFDKPISDHLGLIARYEGSFSGNVRDDDFGGNFSVVYHELFGGVRARYPVDGHLIGFDLTFGQMKAGLDDPNSRSNIPEVSYTQLRSALDVSFDLGTLRATGSAGFRLPLGFGQVSEDEWFPRVGGYGVEASAGLDYPVTKSVSIELMGSLRRYLLEMNATPQDAFEGTSEVAGGAVDRYLAGYLGMTMRL